MSKAYIIRSSSEFRYLNKTRLDNYYGEENICLIFEKCLEKNTYGIIVYESYEWPEEFWLLRRWKEGKNCPEFSYLDDDYDTVGYTIIEASSLIRKTKLKKLNDLLSI